MSVYYEKPVLKQGIVMDMVAAACEQAKQLGIAVNVAVMDDGGNLMVFVRMDRAPLLSVEIAQNKAYTAASFGIPTGDWYPRIQDKPAVLNGIVHTNRMVIFGGGLPIRINGHLVGGIGISGGTSDQDVVCAEAAIAVLAQRLDGQGEQTGK